MKRLLFLGAFSHMIDAVLTAKSMGIFTIAVDKEHNSPAKKYADKSYDIDTSNIDALVEVAKIEKIEGVFNGFEDFNIWTALRLTERLNLPFYATEKQLNIITQKNNFTKFCKEYAIPTLPEYSFDDASNPDIYPLIIKPIDSYGSRGISICRKPEDFAKGLVHSKENSRSGKVMIEPFIESDHGVELYYTIQAGNVFLTATTDRYTVMDNDYSTPLPYSTIYPSQHRDQILRELDPILRKMIKAMALKNGLVLVQCLYIDGKYYAYEMAYRLTGEQHYRLVTRQTGVNLLKMMILLALGESIDYFDMSLYDNDCFAKPACNLAIVLKSGEIARIDGFEEIPNINEVVSYVITHNVGDIIPPTGDYSQILIRINLLADSWKKLKDVIEIINRKIKVVDKDGKDMILQQFHLDRVR